MSLLRIVTQPDETGCGVAVIAIITGMRYDEVARAASRMVGWQPHRRGMSVPQMTSCLRELTSAVWRVSKKFYLIPAAQLPEWTDPHVLLIRRPGEGWGHFIARCEGWVYDPEYLRRASMLKYRRRQWQTIRTLRRHPP